VWHDAQDGHAEKCDLRTKIIVSECETDQSYNLRLLTRHTAITKEKAARAPSHAPWPGWAAYSATNCYEGHGGEHIAGKDPLPGHKLLKDCQEDCLSDERCDAIVMHVQDNGVDDNCWLRSQVAVDKCEMNQAFNLWLAPVYNKSAGGYVPHTWTSHHGTNCQPGLGGERIDDVDALFGHHSLFECENACLGEPRCEGIVWRVQQDGRLDNCFLRRDIDLSQCESSQAYNLRLLHRVTTSTTTTSSSSAPGPWGWRKYASTNCFEGKGAERIVGADPVAGHKLVKECKEECLADASCDAIVMQNGIDEWSNNCWLRKNIEIEKCATNPVFDVWLSPVYNMTIEGYRPHTWTSHHGMNCHPGHGASMIEGNAFLTGHRLVVDCEETCLAQPACEGIVWQDTGDSTSNNCYLRAGIDFSACERNPAFNLRVLSRGTTTTTTAAPAAPSGWSEHPSLNCYTGHGGDWIEGKDPVVGHKSLQGCQDECLLEAGCEAILMKDTQDAVSDNCWLRKNVQIDACVENHTFNLWMAPGFGVGVWEMHHDLNCYPGNGAEMINGQDRIFGHKRLVECQATCVAVIDCEGFIWHDTGDSISDNCYLRKNINISACQAAESFNLKLRTDINDKSVEIMDDATVPRVVGVLGAHSVGLGLFILVSSGLIGTAALMLIRKRRVTFSDRRGYSAVMLSSRREEDEDEAHEDDDSGREDDFDFEEEGFLDGPEELRSLV